ncbi:hypothetical protein ACFWPX_29830 [Nocardia sp. NPDC058518]|uniref:hypothetical protein n=1 Tax=Nocardia sp. NPDC058518 TaxID=3346534 RepID=UPI003669A667
MSATPRAGSWRGRPSAGGLLGRVGGVVTAIGWFYVVMAFLGLAMSGTLSWSYLGWSATVSALGVTIMMIAGYRQWHDGEPR